MGNQYWLGTTDNNWSTASNWESSPSAGDDSGPPASGDVVIFNDDGDVNCTVDAATAEIASLTMGGTGAIYSSTITANAKIQMTDNFIIESGCMGSIDLNGQDMDVDGNFVVDGSGTFDCGEGTITVGGDFDNKDQTTWTRGSSTVVLTGTGVDITGNTANPFTSLTVSVSATIVDATASGVYVYGTLDLDGTLTLLDPLSIMTGGNLTGSGTLSSNGAGDYCLIYDSGTLAGWSGTFSGNGVFYIRAPITVGPFTLASTATLYFQRATSGAGTLTLNAGTYDLNGEVIWYTQSSGRELVVSPASGVYFNYGGDVTISLNGGTITYNKGDGDITLDGSGDQSVNLDFGAQVEQIIIDNDAGQGVGGITLTGDLDCVGIEFGASANCDVDNATNNCDVTLGTGGLDCTNGSFVTLIMGTATTWTCNGDWNQGADITVTRGTAKVVLAGTGDYIGPNATAGSVDKIEVSGTYAYPSATRGAYSSFVVKNGGTFSVNVGVHPATNATTLVYDGVITVENGGELSGAGAIYIRSATISNLGTWSVDTHTTLSCTIEAGTYGGDWLFRSENATRTLTINGALVFTGDVEFASKITEVYTVDNSGDHNLEFQKNVTVTEDGTTYWTAGATATITLSGGSDQTITTPVGWAEEMEQIIIDNDAGRGVGGIILAGDLVTVGIEFAATADCDVDNATNNCDVTLGTGGLDCTNGGNVDLYMGTGTWTCSGDFDVSALNALDDGTSLIVMAKSGAASLTTDDMVPIYLLKINNGCTCTWHGVGSKRINLNGGLEVEAGAELITAADLHSASNWQVGNTGAMTINGTLTIGNYVTVRGDWTFGASSELAGGTLVLQIYVSDTNCWGVTAGATFSLSTLSIRAYMPTTGNIISTFNAPNTNVELLGYRGSACGLVIDDSGTLTCANLDIGSRSIGDFELYNSTNHPSFDVSGDLTVNDTSTGVTIWDVGTGSITLSGDSNQTITTPIGWSDEIEQITIASTVGQGVGGITLAGDLPCVGIDFKDDSSADCDVDAAGYDVTLGTGGLDCTYGGSVTLDLGSGTWTCSGDFIADGLDTLTPGTATVVFDGTTDVYISTPAWRLKTVTVSGTVNVESAFFGDASVTIQNGGTVSVNYAGVTVIVYAGTLTIDEGGTLTGSGTLPVVRQGTITNNGTWSLDSCSIRQDTTINAGTYGGAITFYNVVSGHTLTIGGALVFTGDVTFEVDAGETYNISNAGDGGNGYNLEFQGDVTFTDNGTGTFNYTPGNTATITLSGAENQAIDFYDETIEDLVLDKTAGTVTFTNGWTSDSFSAGEGTDASTIAFDSTGAELITTGDFTISTGAQVDPTNLDGWTWTVGNNLTLAGENGDLLNLVATGEWSLVVSGTNSVSYVDVAYSNATGSSAQIDATDGTSTNSGNNTFWSFTAAIKTFCKKIRNLIARPQNFSLNSQHPLWDDCTFAALSQSVNTFSFYDSSKYHNAAGTLVNMTTDDWINDEGYPAVSMDGISNYITIPQQFNVEDTNVFSFAGWYRRRRLVNYEWLFCEQGTGNNNNEIELYTSSGGSITAAYWVGTSGRAMNGVDTTLDEWIHIAFTFDANGGTMWINGIVVDTEPAGGSPSATGSTWYLGTRPAFDYYYQGDMRDTIIWKRIITQTDVDLLASRDPMLQGAIVPANRFWFFAPSTGVIVYYPIAAFKKRRRSIYQR